MLPNDICICGQDRSAHAQGFGAAISGSCSSFRLASHAPETSIGVALEDSVPLGNGNHLVRVALGAKVVPTPCAPTGFCNKCGFFGETNAAGVHNRPGTTNGCNYLAIRCTPGTHVFEQAVPLALQIALEMWCAGIIEQRPPNQEIGRSGNPYLDRWFLGRKIVVPAYSGPPDFDDSAPPMPSELENVYLHGYHRGDADEPHDHPWPNASLVARGWYREAVYDADGVTLIGEYTRRRGDIVLRSAKAVHAILETSPDCLSLFATLRKQRDWGFHTADGFVPWREFGGG